MFAQDRCLVVLAPSVCFIKMFSEYRFSKHEICEEKNRIFYFFSLL